jgi:hypothetical protein
MPKILYIDYSQAEWEVSRTGYEPYLERVSSRIEFLRRHEHEVTPIFDLEKLTDEVYISQDLVFAHVTWKKVARIIELHDKYPHITLALCSGSQMVNSRLVECYPGRNHEGLYQLDMESADEKFLENIEKILRQSKR